MLITNEITVSTTVVQRLELRVLLEEQAFFLLLQLKSLFFDFLHLLVLLHQCSLDRALLLGGFLFLTPDLL